MPKHQKRHDHAASGKADAEIPDASICAHSMRRRRETDARRFGCGGTGGSEGIGVSSTDRYQSLGVTAPHVTLYTSAIQTLDGWRYPRTHLATADSLAPMARASEAYDHPSPASDLNHSSSVMALSVPDMAERSKPERKDKAQRSEAHQTKEISCAKIQFADDADQWRGGDSQVTKHERSKVSAGLGERMALVRKLMDTNRTRFAEQYGVSDSAWLKWEGGQREPKMELLAQFCDRTGATLDWLVRGKFKSLPHKLAVAMIQKYPEIAARDGWQLGESNPIDYLDSPFPEHPPKPKRRRPGEQSFKPDEEEDQN